MSKEVRFRILNKTSRDVTVKFGDKPMTFSWEEFNKKLVVVDKFWAVLNEEEKKKHEQAEEAISWAIVHFLSMKAAEGNPEKSKEYMVNALGFGQRMEEVQKLLECSMLEATKIVRQRLMMMNPFMVNPMFSDEDMRKNGIHTRKSLRPKRGDGVSFDDKGNRQVVVAEADSGKPTLGDAFSCLCELKEKMEKE